MMWDSGFSQSGNGCLGKIGGVKTMCFETKSVRRPRKRTVAIQGTVFKLRTRAELKLSGQTTAHAPHYRSLRFKKLLNNSKN